MEERHLSVLESALRNHFDFRAGEEDCLALIEVACLTLCSRDFVEELIRDFEESFGSNPTMLNGTWQIIELFRKNFTH